MRRGPAIALLLIAALAVGVALVGRERVWRILTGPPDQGAVDWASLERRLLDNDILVCPPTLCPAPGDFPAALYQMPADELGALSDKIMSMVSPLTDLQRADDGADPLYRRYVGRAPYTRAPDTMEIRFFPVGATDSTLAIYSRSLRYWPGFGLNLKRVTAWGAWLESAPHVHEGEPGFRTMEQTEGE